MITYTVLSITALAVMLGLVVVGLLGVLGKLPGAAQKRVSSYTALGIGVVSVIAILRGWLMFNAL